jgi:hypothetical protein
MTQTTTLSDIIETLCNILHIARTLRGKLVKFMKLLSRRTCINVTDDTAQLYFRGIG